MNKVYIMLKSGKEIFVEDFKYIKHPSVGGGESVIVDKFEDFYLYSYLLTFVGKSSIVTLSSEDIEFIKFSGNP